MNYEEAPKVIKILVDNYVITVKTNVYKLEQVPDEFLYKNEYYNLRFMVETFL